MSSTKRNSIGTIAVVAALAASTIAIMPANNVSAGHSSFAVGDVFVGESFGPGGSDIQWHHPDGTLNGILDSGFGCCEATGMAFDGSLNMLSTHFSNSAVVQFAPDGTLVGPFGSGYDCDAESVAFNAVGEVYVGQADCTQDVLKFAADGTPLGAFDVATEVRGSDWIDLAADQCTLYYTSEGASVLRYDVCTDTQLANFAGPLPGSNAFALRILSDGGVIVADRQVIVRLDNAGVVAQTYDVDGEDFFFAANLDPDGVHFWSAGYFTGNVYKFDIATGAVALTFSAGTGVSGLAVAGEPTQGGPEPPGECVSILFADDFDGENGDTPVLNYFGWTNWDVTDGSVDLIGSGTGGTAFDFYPGNGLYVDLDGSTSNPGVFATKAGVLNLPAGNLLLEFELGGSTRGDSNDVHVEIPGLYTEDFTLASADPLTVYSRPLVVGAPTAATLSFENSGADNLGAILTHASVCTTAEAPEPPTLGETCSSEAREVCKSADYADADGDGLIEVGEHVTFDQTIEINNPGPATWSNTVVTDNFGAEIHVTGTSASQGTVTITFVNGQSQKERLKWDVGTVLGGAGATLDVDSETKLDPSGDQTYTTCGVHEYNSGAVLKATVPGTKKPQQVAFGSGSLLATVWTEDQEGDCDGDGFSDADELDAGTDPFDPLDFPSCGGTSMTDVCIDADGITTAGSGIPGALEVVFGDALTGFPVTGPIVSGLDFFDRDGSGTYTPGDDFHSEDPNTCATAIRNAVYDLGADCLVLDLNGDMPDQLPVDCDMEFMIAFNVCPVNVTWFDQNGDGSWQSGEDLILDVNADGVFN